MFERTLEAQALDAPHAKLSPFSIALLVHLTVFAVIFVISLVMVPKIIEPQPPEHLIVAVFHEPLEYVREQAASPAPPAAMTLSSLDSLEVVSYPARPGRQSALTRRRRN